MNILVTGSLGYIGSWLGPILMERGHRVTGLDAAYFHAKPWYDPAFRRQPVTVCEDTRMVPVSFLRGFDAVIHLAELSNDPLSQVLTEATLKINYEGSTALAAKCKQAGVKRFVYSSSCSVYGIGDGDELKTEQSAKNPQTTYARCKTMVEKELMALSDRSFSAVTLRNATAYGRSPSMRFDLVLNNLSGLAWTSGEVRMTSDGTPWRPLVNVQDICQAMAVVVEAPRHTIHNQVFNVGDNSQNYQVKDIALIVADVFTGCQLKFGQPDGDNRSYRVSFDKINSLLPNFRCQYTARDGAMLLRQTFADIKMKPTGFNNRTYTRLQQVLYLRETGQINEELFWEDGRYGSNAVGML